MRSSFASPVNRLILFKTSRRRLSLLTLIVRSNERDSFPEIKE